MSGTSDISCIKELTTAVDSENKHSCRIISSCKKSKRKRKRSSIEKNCSEVNSSLYGLNNVNVQQTSKRSKRKKRRFDEKMSLTKGAGETVAIQGQQSKNESKSVVENNLQHSKKQQFVRSSNYPYPTDYNDHFETPLRAYTDIFPLMQDALNKKDEQEGNAKNSPSKLTIYDPYFCTGRAASLLEQTFSHYKSKSNAVIYIQHEKRDFYKDICKNKIPEHHILVTNPPYSGNHKERCLEFAVNQLKSHGTIFFLLMPNYIANKEYFRKLVLEKNVKTVFVAPPSNQPYEYDHPEGTGHEKPPFQSVWFCGLGFKKSGDADIKKVKDCFTRYHKFNCKGRESCIPRIASDLHELASMGYISSEKRKNPRQRKKMRALAMKKADQTAK